MLLISFCLGSKQRPLVPNDLISEIIQNHMVYNDTGLAINKTLLSQVTKDPEDVEKILVLLENLVKKTEGKIKGLDNKVNEVAAALDKTNKKANKVITKEKVKVGAAKQALKDAKSVQSKSGAELNSELAILHKVIAYLWPMSNRKFKMSGWKTCSATVNCGSLGKNVCQGYYKNNILTNTVKGAIPGKTYSVSLTFIALDSWDAYQKEVGFVNVNSKRCWTSPILDHTKFPNYRKGKHCNNPVDLKYWGERKFAVSCSITAPASGIMKVNAQSRFKVNSGIEDESFGVTDLVVKRVK